MTDGDKLNVIERAKKIQAEGGKINGIKVFILSMELGSFIEIFDQPLEDFVEDGPNKAEEIQNYLKTMQRLFYEGDGDETQKIQLENGLDTIFIREPRKYIFKLELY